ncbi:MAG TPA: ThuA domain-containing protein [Candidatus Paenibacillus intestinavium]|nr:ThuA domain-containing protein [Candidatus Paenibacillus intestinavium]
MINVTIWNEFLHEKEHEEVTRVYPEGIHIALQKGLASDELNIRTATLEEAEHGLTEEVLQQTDVLVWWGHMGHDRVEDHIVDRVHARVMEGMGLIVLHSAHFSKVFKKLMGTGCDLKWREANEKERLWVVNPGHRIAEGLPEYITLEHEEMYGEHFDIPAPDELVFLSWFQGGEVFRSGCTFYRGQGKIFYFRPGHETFPTYYNEHILKVIDNSIHWAKPTITATPVRGNHQPLETL